MAAPGFTINIGDTGEVSQEKADRLIGLGYAEAISPRKKPEVVKTVISKSSTKSGKKK